MKKYELTQNTKIIYSTILYQIKALIDIPQKEVKIGDLGGYIQFQNNLSHKGLCWVADEACVWGKALVYGNAEVYGNAGVSGTAQICHNAQIYDNAHVYGNARIYGNAKVFSEGRVYDNAEVFDNASVCGFANVRDMVQVSGMAQVYDNASVRDYAWVYGEAQVGGYAQVGGKTELIGGHWSENPISIIGSLHHICQCDTNKIRIGCITLTFDEWLEEFEEIGYDNDYTDKQIKEYKIFIDAIINANLVS